MNQHSHWLGNYLEHLKTSMSKEKEERRRRINSSRWSSSIQDETQFKKRHVEDQEKYLEMSQAIVDGHSKVKLKYLKDTEKCCDKKKAPKSQSDKPSILATAKTTQSCYNDSQVDSCNSSASANYMGYQRDEVGRKTNVEAFSNPPLATKTSEQSCSPIKELIQPENHERRSSSRRAVAQINVATSTAAPFDVQIPITVNFSTQSSLTYEEQLLLNNDIELGENDYDQYFVNPSEVDSNNLEDEQNLADIDDDDTFQLEDFQSLEDFNDSEVWNQVVINIRQHGSNATENANDFEDQQTDDGKSITVVEVPSESNLDLPNLVNPEVLFPDQLDTAYSDMTSNSFNMRRKYRPALKISMPTVVVSNDNGFRTPKVEPFPFYSSPRANSMKSAFSPKRTELPRLPKQQSLNLDFTQRRSQLSPPDTAQPNTFRSSPTSKPRWSIKRGGIPPLVRMNTPNSSAFVRPFSRSQLLSEPDETSWSSFNNVNQQPFPKSVSESRLTQRANQPADNRFERNSGSPTERFWSLSKQDPLLNSASESQLLSKTYASRYEEENSLDEGGDNFVSGKALYVEERIPSTRKKSTQNQQNPRIFPSPANKHLNYIDVNNSNELDANIPEIITESIQDLGWWQMPISIPTSEIQINYQDFGIQDYLSIESEVADIEENLSIAGDFDKGLEVDPPSDLLEQITLVQEEKLGPASPDRTESPLLLMDEDGIMHDEELDLKEVMKKMQAMNQEAREQLQRKFLTPPYMNVDTSSDMDMMLNLDDETEEEALVALEKEIKKFREANSQMVRMSAINFNQLNQQELDEALNIKEDKSNAKGLSSSDDDLEDDIRSVQRLP